MVASRDMQGHSALENGLAADPIAAALDSALAHQVDLPAEQTSELEAHGFVVEQAPGGVGLEVDEDVHVAVRAEVAAQHGAEQLEAAHLPPAAELAECCSVYVQLRHGHG
jgi:hypothetical protein